MKDSFLCVGYAGRLTTLEFDHAPNTERFDACLDGFGTEALDADRHSGLPDSLLSTDFDKHSQMCERSHIEHESMTVVKREAREMVEMFAEIWFACRHGMRIVVANSY